MTLHKYNYDAFLLHQKYLVVGERAFQFNAWLRFCRCNGDVVEFDRAYFIMLHVVVQLGALKLIE